MEVVNAQRKFFHDQKTKPVELRLLRLKALYCGILKYEQQLTEALKQDLNKSAFDSYTTEIGYTLKEISHTIKYLERWCKPKKVCKAPIYFVGAKSYIINEPYGVTLIIAPWNYPFQLAIVPLIGALAAGNTAIVKPSELTPNVSKALSVMLEELFPAELVAVVEGGKEVSESLLRQKFDYIFFTGSTEVGKIVMESAAKNLVPVTLELGGKSPTIVHKDANLPLAARRIAWGKFLNAGQTCVAPDYVYVHSEVKKEFLVLLKEEIKKMYGVSPLQNKDYTRIIHKKHFDRLTSLLTGAKVVIGGESDEGNLLIEPTVLDQVTWCMPVMKEEIFGPILPTMEYDDIQVAISEIVSKPKPLALYLFTESKKIEDNILRNISFGGGCINDTLYHLTQPYLSFGGVGESGMGSYHGEYSFQTFSHQKSIVKQTTKFDISLRYRSSKEMLKIMRKLLK